MNCANERDEANDRVRMIEREQHAQELIARTSERANEREQHADG